MPLAKTIAKAHAALLALDHSSLPQSCNSRPKSDLCRYLHVLLYLFWKHDVCVVCTCSHACVIMGVGTADVTGMSAPWQERSVCCAVLSHCSGDRWDSAMIPAKDIMDSEMLKGSRSSMTRTDAPRAGNRAPPHNRLRMGVWRWGGDMTRPV